MKNPGTLQTKVEDGTPNMKVISDYEGAKHDDHWYNASSTLILLDVKKETYEFHCFMSFHQDTHLNYSESLDPICELSFTGPRLVVETCRHRIP